MGAVNPSGKPFMQIQFTMETKENNNEKEEDGYIRVVKLLLLLLFSFPQVRSDYRYYFYYNTLSMYCTSLLSYKVLIDPCCSFSFKTVLLNRALVHGGNFYFFQIAQYTAPNCRKNNLFRGNVIFGLNVDMPYIIKLL